MAEVIERQSPYIHHNELREICGRTRKSKQIEWLKSKRIRHTTNAYGQPVVLRAHLEAVLSEPRTKAPAAPNWEALHA